jgi:hypothetical protein
MTLDMNDHEHFARALDLQGLALPPARQANVAANVGRQIAAERNATARIEFEVEPATFFRMLEEGSR